MDTAARRPADHGPLRLPRLGPLRQAARLPLHGLEPDGRPRRGGDPPRSRPVTLVAHDASGPPAIDWALANPRRVAALVLLNTYYHWTPALRRPPAIALYSTPVLRSAARAVVRRWPGVDRRLYSWQVGRRGE